jgi:2-polyprenyl-3-methyl-5-hydroxy-6-metoxy-1,4-benzoquinol methylase
MNNNKPDFDYSNIPAGYYDDIARKRKGMRSFWHWHKFQRIIDMLDQTGGKILDIGCFGGTFLGMIPEEVMREQVGIDILEEQISYASKTYGTGFRKFLLVKDFDNKNFLPSGYFDVVCLIEVIEHLTTAQIMGILDFAHNKLRAGGQLIITTPNYTSLWPLLEIFLNKISDVNYEEQHITRFGYFDAVDKLRSILPDFDTKFSFEYITSTHAFTPYLAAVSFRLAEKISTMISPGKWKIPLGSILILNLYKKY